MTQNFDTAIAGDARLIARFDGIFDKVKADAAAVGLTITADDLKACPSVKLATFSEMGLNSEDVLTELRRLPHIAKQAHKAEVINQLNRGDSDLHRELDRLNPFQKMAFGRQLEAQKAAQKAAQSPTHNPSMSAEEEAKALRIIQSLSSPQARLNAGRELGLI